MKKGQITMFIIVGIVILLVLGLGVVAWKIINEQKPPEDKLGEETNVALKPLQTYVKACLENTAREVLTDTALHGGYYKPQEKGFVAIPGRPTDGRALETFEGTLIPYWSYLASPNNCVNCVVASEQPPLEGDRFPAIEYQVEQAIEENINTCLKDFDNFKNEFKITTKSEPTVTVNFGNSVSEITLNYVIDVETGAQSVSTIKSFTVLLDVPFKRAYDYATQIREQINSADQPYFEGLTLEIITLTAVGPLDKEPIPPPFGGTIQSNYPGPYWTIPQTKQILSQALAVNIPNVQLLGSADMDYVNSDDPFTNNYYANYYFTIAEPNSQIKTSFMYLPRWEPYLAIHPGTQVVYPEPLSVNLPFMPRYKKADFQYDISYPLLVQLTLPSPGREDLLFQFPVEVNLRNNNPVSYDGIVIAQPDYNFCDPIIATGSIINVRVHDEANQPVSAEVVYSCVGNSCSIGNANGGQLSNVNLATCIGGELSATREGYKDARVPFDSSAGKNGEVELLMVKKTSVEIDARGRFITRAINYEGENPIAGWDLASDSFNIDVPQKMLMVITPRDDSEGAQVLSWPDDSGLGHTISLYPGEYDIVAVVTEELSEPKIVHGESFCEGGIAGVGETCVTIPDITLGGGSYTDESGEEQTIESSSMYLGGLDWNENTKNVTITQEMLDTGKLQIDVPIIYLPDVQKIGKDRNDLDVFEKIEQFGKQIEIS